MLYPNKKSRPLKVGFPFVQAERLELSHLAALDPKSSMSTNSITPASLKKNQHELWCPKGSRFNFGVQI